MTLRTRTAVSMIGVVAAYGVVATLVGGYLLRRHVGLEAENRVRQDLNAADAFYRQRLAEMGAALRYTALGERFRQAVAERDLTYLSARLAAVQRSARLDVLCLTDAAGRVIGRANHEDLAGDSLADHALVRPILEGREAASGTILVPIEALARESPTLAERARIPIVATPRARPSEGTHLAAGMVQAASAPVRGPNGRLAGVLLAETLLNQDYDLVDQVRNTVFRDEQYGGKGLGTATIFQDDVRISTNVLHEDGTRAVGSRVSAEVYDRVLRQGRTCSAGPGSSTIGTSPPTRPSAMWTARQSACSTWGSWRRSTGA